ncbi:MAG: N-acetylmuramoyl-L-alanine amidase, partial [Actinobacteria bacterium]
RRSRNMVILARGKRVKRSSGKGKASLSTKRISINASAKRIRPRQPILIYGKATFPDKTTLTLRYKKGRGGWRTLKTLSTKNQRYKTKVRLNSASRYVFALRKGKTASRNMIVYSRGKPVKVVRKKKKKKSRGRPLIVVDPGHGGRQAGAIGSGGLREKTVNLKVGLKLRNYLKRAGARVVMTRTNDKTLSLKARVNIAKRVKANRFVSVHHNSTRNRRVNGTETYVRRGASKTSKDMARKVHRSLLRNLKLANRKMRSANFYVLRYNRIPAILTEASFISNRRQAKRLRSSSYLDKEARAIFYGLKSHMEFGRLYTPLAIQGTSAPASDIHFANVVDTNAYWRSIVSIKNTSAILQAVTLNFYNDNGTLLSSNNVDIAPNKVYSFYPKKILSAEFSGSIRATAAMPSLVGQLSQVSNNNKAIANVQALQGSTELHVPHIVDNSSWKSFVTLKNTADSLGTATINLFNYDGTLAKTETVNIGPQAKYSFYPQTLVGQAFSGSVEIMGSTPLVGYVNRINVKQLRLGIAPAMIKNSEHYFAQAPENSAWRSYISIKNISSNTQTTTISAYKADGSVAKKTNIEIAPKAVYKIRVAEIVSSRFNGAIKISGQSNSLAAYLTQTDKKAKTLAILEGQQGLTVVDFAHVNDGGNPWNSEIAVSNTSGRANVNIGLYSGGGTVLSSITHSLNENGYYRFYPFETVNNSFIGSIKASTSNNQAVGYLATSR